MGECSACPYTQQCGPALTSLKRGQERERYSMYTERECKVKYYRATLHMFRLHGIVLASMHVHVHTHDVPLHLNCTYNGTSSHISFSFVQLQGVHPHFVRAFHCTTIHRMWHVVQERQTKTTRLCPVKSSKSLPTFGPPEAAAFGWPDRTPDRSKSRPSRAASVPFQPAIVIIGQVPA